ncbi:blood group Rh(D) polypeptide isoform X3 [Mastomys coucha]|uniref:blood group Rh(D) polypeptide isoform X3 n=1 Tax=Mastomys coucha TaxID=35658 RepID=UPI0012624D89|nr:blood group Rh(D) polypeptide isoform X3 [Mastomys coucha]
MGSKYPRSLRCCLPLWALVLQTAFSLLFCFFIAHDTAQVDHKFMASYQVLRDLTLVAALGFGFLSSSFRRLSWSSVAFNLFMLALGVQGTILLDHFLRQVLQWNKINNLSRSLPRRVGENAQTEKAQMATSSSLFAMLGTLFLWIFWPSINSALLEGTKKRNAVFNTYYALAVSTVTATSMSALSHPQGKINMVHIHNAVLAGGVAVGAPGCLISSPWIAMVLGLTAGLISIWGAKCPRACLNHMLQNPSGIHYTFGLPGLLGALTYYLLQIVTEPRYSELWIIAQTVTDIGALSFAVAMGMVTGLLTGCLLSVKVWRAPHAAKYFDDQTFWEFPHLAVGF